MSICKYIPYYYLQIHFTFLFLLINFVIITHLQNCFKQGTATIIQSIHMENVDKTGRMPSQIMEDILDLYDVPLEKQVCNFNFLTFFSQVLLYH